MVMIAFNLLSTNIFSKFVISIVQALNYILYMPNEAFLKARYNEEKIMEKRVEHSTEEASIQNNAIDF